MRLLLINPALPESFWSFRWALERILRGKRSLNSPLGLATLAALCGADVLHPQPQRRVGPPLLALVENEPRFAGGGVAVLVARLPVRERGCECERYGDGECGVADHGCSPECN
jgi:hypothetical protein